MKIEADFFMNFQIWKKTYGLKLTLKFHDYLLISFYE